MDLARRARDRGGAPSSRRRRGALDAADSLPGGPIGGLTVVRFRNAHLAYALTWYGLAALSALGALLVLRPGRVA